MLNELPDPDLRRNLLEDTGIYIQTRGENGLVEFIRQCQHRDKIAGIPDEIKRQKVFYNVNEYTNFSKNLAMCDFWLSSIWYFINLKEWHIQ